MRREQLIRAAILFFCILLCVPAGCGCDRAYDGGDPEFVNSGKYECDFEIKPIVFKKFGKHIYYQEGKFFTNEQYQGQNEAVRKCFEDKDSEETQDIYVYNYIADGRDGKVTDIQLYGRGYVNGIIVENKGYYAQYVSKVKHFTRMYSVGRKHTPRRSSAVDPKKIFPKVAELACKNKHSMYMDQGNKIYGTYLLKYNDSSDYLYYDFIINRYSSVRVNARTGEIDKSEFKNGTPEDIAYD